MVVSHPLFESYGKTGFWSRCGSLTISASERTIIGLHNYTKGATLLVQLVSAATHVMTWHVSLELESE